MISKVKGQNRKVTWSVSAVLAQWPVSLEAGGSIPCRPNPAGKLLVLFVSLFVLHFTVNKVVCNVVVFNDKPRHCKTMQQKHNIIYEGLNSSSAFIVTHLFMPFLPYALTPYLGDTEDDGGQVHGKQQQLAGKKVPDPSNKSFLFPHRTACEAWSTLVEGHSAGWSPHLRFMVDPVLRHVHGPTSTQFTTLDCVHRAQTSTEAFNLNQKWSGVGIQVSRLIRIPIWMSAALLPKCCGFVILSASVVSPSVVKICRWLCEKC